MSADRPEPRRLGEDQGLPGDFLVGFTHRLLDRRQQLLRQGQPPKVARERAVAEAVQAFHAGADEHRWTVAERRVASLAGDTLGLEDEHRDQHGYEPELARLYAVGEVLEGERCRRGDPRAVATRGRPGPPACARPPAAPPVRADRSRRPHGQRPDTGGRL